MLHNRDEVPQIVSHSLAESA